MAPSVGFGKEMRGSLASGRRLISWLIAALALTATARGDEQRAGEDFYPTWAASEPFNQPLLVRDTDSAIGRLSLRPKRLTLEDLARVHGHLCDGLAVAWVALGAGLRSLFPDGVVDRTDVRTVSKNGPCWSDAAAWTTGARVNHGTLVLDAAVGDSFILQRVSAHRAVRVGLRPGVLPKDLARLETSIRERRALGEAVRPEEIDEFEKRAAEFIHRLLDSPPESVVDLQELHDFAFPGHSPSLIAPRSDVINKELPRTPGRE